MLNSAAFVRLACHFLELGLLTVSPLAQGAIQDPQNIGSHQRKDCILFGEGILLDAGHIALLTSKCRSIVSCQHQKCLFLAGRTCQEESSTSNCLGQI